jgi:hypothetical protein
MKYLLFVWLDHEWIQLFMKHDHKISVAFLFYFWKYLEKDYFNIVDHMINHEHF